MAKQKELSAKQIANLGANKVFASIHGEQLSLEEINKYDKIVVAFSGGKDSIACVLHLLSIGVKPEQIELWHHDVDGREGSDLMDWGCTADYCREVAKALGMEIYFSWRKGGIEAELTKKESKSQNIMLEEPIFDHNGNLEGTMVREQLNNKSHIKTRRMFPAKGANLQTRWCSPSAKIEVGNYSLNNQKRFLNIKTLFITGERGQESTNRSFYAKFEEHKCFSNKRVKREVYAYRPVLDWSEEQVWKIMEEFRINPHPAYKLGWGRVSCAGCIFGNANQWASLLKVNENQFNQISAYEKDFNHTIDAKISIVEMAEKGTAYEMNEQDMNDAVNKTYSQKIILDLDEKWELPKGAYGDSCGPT